MNNIVIGGASGGAGALVILNTHIFATTTARDTYFTANPAEKKDGTYIKVGTTFERYNINNTTWEDVTAILQGKKGDTGATGATGAKGDKGDTGEKGETGVAGANGTNGADGQDGGAIANDYVATNAYKKGEMVKYTDANVYIANDDIPANTAWVVGTTGATWKAIGNGGSGGGSSSLLDPVSDITALKAVDTTSITTVQTVQVTTLGLYKFQPGSTLTGDDVNVITPTVGTGRWIKQSQKKYAKYNFRLVDYGANNCFYRMKGKGKLAFGGSGSWGTDAENAIITCDELIGNNKFIKFKVANMNNYPSIFVACNGTKVAKGDSFRGLAVNISEIGEVTLVKYTGNSKTTLKSGYVSKASELIIKKYGKRLSVSATGLIDNDTRDVIWVEDDYLLAYGNMCGFAANAGNLGFYKSLEIGNLDSYPVNIVFDGDSQMSNSMSRNGMGTIDQFRLLSKYKNVDVKMIGYGGKKLTDTVANLQTHIIDNASAYAQNIYYVCLGTNDYASDTAETMLTNLDTIIASAKSKGYKIAVATVMFYNNASAPPQRIIDFNQGIRDRKTSGAIDYLIDVYDTSKIDVIDTVYGGTYRKYTIYDNLHFTQDCREKFAKYIYETIGISSMSNIINEVDEENEIDALDFSPEDYTKLYNSFDRSYMTSDYLTEGSSKLLMTTTERNKLANINAVGTAVASETIITAPSTIFHVTGTTAISTITIPYTGFTGKINIIPDGLFTLATGGNIYEAYTAAVGRVIELVYDGTSWYRSNS